MRRGLVIGGGGTLGTAWSVGALAAVEDALGWDAREAEVIVGSGSGAEIAAVLGAGYTTQDMVRSLTGHPGAPGLLAEQFAADRRTLPGVPLPAPSSLGLALAGLRRRVPAQAVLSGLLPVGTGSFERLVELGRSLALLSTGGAQGWVAHPQTWVVAAERRTGRRVPFGFRTAPHADLGVALAAAGARPGWFPPVRVGDRAYVEAAVASPTSADLVLPLGLDEVVLVAPTTSRDARLGLGLSTIERLLRRGSTMRLDLEERALAAAGTRVVRVEPGPADLAAMGVNVMDHRRRREVTLTSLSTSPDRVAAAVRRGGGPTPAAVPHTAAAALTRGAAAEQDLRLPPSRTRLSRPTGDAPPALRSRLRRWFG